MASELADVLDRAARVLGLDLTLVGHHDRLHLDGRFLIGPRHQSHRVRPVCDLGFGPQCSAHCRWQVNHRLERRPQPFATRCWKGVREIAVPLRSQGLHLGTLYAGTWRQAAAPPAAVRLPAAWLAAWRALPLWDEARLEALGPVLALLADGLASRLAAALAGSPGGRGPGELIDGWLRVHAPLPVRLADCAEYLGLSASRTGALVRRHCGEPFALALRRRRLERARLLLRTTTAPIQAVARDCGFEDPAWFSRAFAAAYGRSPRAWRQQPSPRVPPRGG